MMNSSLVISGLGAVTPIGIGVDNFWNALINGEKGVTTITRFDASSLPVQIAGEVKNFDPVDYIPKKLSKEMDPFMQYAFIAANEAIGDSGLDVKSERIAIVMSSALNGITTISETEHSCTEKGAYRVSPRFVPKVLGNVAASQIAIYHEIQGPCLTLNTACASGVDAIGTAAMLIKAGEAEAAIAVGADSTICPIMVSGLAMSKALSTDNDNPAGACKPFDANRTGFVIGEGGGAVIIETEEHAKKRGAKIYARLKGYDSNTDGYHVTSPAPDGKGAISCMERAIQKAGITTTDIDYINTHGTATKVGDAIELEAIRNVFGNGADVAVGSTKGQTGHMMAGGGVIETIVCIKSICEDVVPATVNCETLDEKCEGINVVTGKSRNQTVRNAMSNAFGFGGQNASVIVGKYEDGGDQIMDYTYDVTMFQETFEHEFTYIKGFMRNTHRFADSNAMYCPIRDKHWTYKSLNEDVNMLAHALIKDGVKKNDVVMYQLYNCAEFVMCFLAPQKLGAINSPINFRLSPGETAIILDDSKPTVFFYDAECREMSEQALKMAKHKPKTVVMVDIFGKEEAPEGVLTYEEYVTGQSTEEPPEVKRHIYDENTRLYTSGTTGMPKGVPVNNVNEVLSAHDVIMHFPLSTTDKTMNLSPWFHRGGLHSGGPVPTLYLGAEIIIMRAFHPRHSIKVAAEQGATFLIGAPPMLKMICDNQKKRPSDLSKLRGIVTMGAPLERNACIEYQKVLTPNIFNGYGTTESFWNAFLKPSDLPDRAGSVGRACTDDDIRVVKVYDDRRAEPDEVVAKDGEETGEIIIKCPTKSTYYYTGKPEASERTYYKGWMYTSDLGVWDNEEFVTVVGRKDDMIVCSGENIHPVQIEEIINQHEKVSDCIITSVSDELRGQSVVAYVVKSDDSLTVKELVNYCKNHPMLSAYKCPRYYRFVDELPHNATGKKLHYKAQEMAKEDKAAGLLERI